MKRTTFLIFLLIASACSAPRVAVNKNADFSNIKRVAVLDFSGPRGDIAADFMIQNLMMRGINVVERRRLRAVMNELNLTNSSAFNPSTTRKLGELLGVDALFLGTVVKISDAASYIITTGEQSFSNVDRVDNSTLYSEGSVMGIPNSQIITSAAQVSLISRMVDVETGSIIWSASMTYEGFDASSAIDAISRSFVKSLANIWPEIASR